MGIVIKYGVPRMHSMVHTEWNGYQRRFSASEWHLLFDSTDGRSRLTWRDRFSALPDSVNYANFYSSGENVLATYAGIQPSLSDLRNILDGPNSWVLQEKWKGHPLGFGGSDYMGWGFNRTDTQYNPYDIDLGTIAHLGPINANSSILANNQLIARPFFLNDAPSGIANTLFSDATVDFSVIKPYYNRLLAYAIPALTNATGGEDGASFTKFRESAKVINMNNEKNDATWPVSRNRRWHHSDIKEVALPFVVNVVDQIAVIGGLK